MSENIKKYINFCLERGLEKKEIKEKLITSGWKESEINEFFTEPIEEKIVTEEKTKEEIYKEFLSKGFKIEEIEKALKEKEEKEEINQLKETSHKKTISLTLSFAAFFIGLGIFSFIAANWKSMGDISKMIIILFFISLFYFLGWFFKEKKKLIGVSEAMFLIGSIVYGTGIFLISNIFDINIFPPDGLVIWFLGSLLTGFVFNFPKIINLSLILGFVGGIMYPVFILSKGILSNFFVFSSIFVLLIGFCSAIYVGIFMDKKIKKINS
jgi:cation transport ATPase